VRGKEGEGKRRQNNEKESQSKVVKLKKVGG
jgi:hypothetical protein